jgi:hypothetical protein
MATASPPQPAPEQVFAALAVIPATKASVLCSLGGKGICSIPCAIRPVISTEASQFDRDARRRNPRISRMPPRQQHHAPLRL